MFVAPHFGPKIRLPKDKIYSPYKAIIVPKSQHQLSYCHWPTTASMKILFNKTEVFFFFFFHCSPHPVTHLFDFALLLFPFSCWYALPSLYFTRFILFVILGWSFYHFTSNYNSSCHLMSNIHIPKTILFTFNLSMIPA